MCQFLSLQALKANLLPRHRPCQSILFEGQWSPIDLISTGRGIEMFTSQTFFSPSNMDVLCWYSTQHPPTQSENLVVFDFLKKENKKPCYTPSCPTALATVHFLSLVVLIGDSSVGEVLSTYRIISIATKMHISSNKEISSFAKFS